MRHFFNRIIFLFLFIPLLSSAQLPAVKKAAQYAKEAQRVTIIRDKWGVPHIYGKTDADCVFGLLYAQCEENFDKVEENNLEMMGRLSEVYGEERLYDDLEMKLIYDTAAAIRDYQRSPLWLRKIMDAAADGVNYYLCQHPEVKPKLLTHFEPWFALLRTNGSISATQDGGTTREDMKALYPPRDSSIAYAGKDNELYNHDPMGSNGFAVAPSKTASGNAILYINPHVSFYYRSEAEMESEEGLHVYGAVTWGTFFVFQGFNEYCGWMHTSGIADVADLFSEKVVNRQDSLYTEYDKKLKPVTRKTIVIRYKKADGFAQQTFTVYHTFHGPVMGSRNGQWLSLRENNRSLIALEQSWLRTKAKGFAGFKQVMNLRSNTSDNTVFADNKGNIAYWHGNFIPRRNTTFDYSLPADGSTSATDWAGVYALDSIVHVYNPSTGFIQNCNATPFTAAGTSSPRKDNYPLYMAPDGENFRGITASRLLSQASHLTIDDMIHSIGYSHYLAAFEVILPPLLQDYESLPQNDTLKSSLQEAVSLLQNWNRTSSDTSVATTLAVEWGYRFVRKIQPAGNLYEANHLVEQMNKTVAITTSSERLSMLLETLDDLAHRFGNWRMAWGDVNRYQRPANGQFNDAQLSFSVPSTASVFGSVPVFSSQRFANTSKRYGVYGNSFVACVEFGKRIKAKSIVTGGQLFDPSSPHYTDQAKMYADGDFKEVLFYKEDVMKQAERKYHPGE